MAHLIVEKGSSKGETLELPDRGRVVVGRSEKADFQVPDRFVSRTHFAIQGKDDQYVIQDLDSDNGTFVNGEAIEQEVLDDGDHVQIGETYLSFVTDESRKEREDLIGKEVGGYDILERIGRGGMGTVYKAKQMSLDRVVALKILDSELVKDEKFIEQFFTEARSAAQLNHPNVTKVFDVGEVDDVYYLSMEYISGGSLHDLLSERDVMEPQRAAEIILDVAQALKFAKRKDLVHRDIKPANIMLTDEGQAKLIDLGIAKQGLKEWEEEDVMVGTPDYMAPEQATEQSVDTRADIYALGVTFYRMVTGERPIKGETPDDVIDNKFDTDPIPPSKKNKNLPGWISSLIMDMIQKQPSRRISTPEKVIERLEQGLEGGGGVKRSKKRMLAKHVTSSRWTLFLGAAAVLIALIGTVLVIRYSRSSADKGPTAAERERAKELLKKLRKQRERLNESPSKEQYQITIRNHERFLNRYDKHKKSKQVNVFLKRLRADQSEYLLGKKLSKLRQEFTQIKSSFEKRSLDGVDRITKAIQTLDENVNRIEASIADLQKSFKEASSVEISTFKQSVRDWGSRTSTALNDYREQFKRVSEHIEGDSYREAHDVLSSWKTQDRFQSEPFKSSLETVSRRFQEQERQYYHKQTNEIVAALSSEKFDQVVNQLTTLHQLVASERYRNKLSEKKKSVPEQKQKYDEKRRKERKKKEYENILQQGVDQFVRMERRSIAPGDVGLNLSSAPEFQENKLYHGFFRFLINRYQKFYQILGNRVSEFSIKILEDPQYGQVKITNSSSKWVELTIPDPQVSATSRRAWNEFDIKQVLDFVFQNRNDLKPDERTTVAVMYYLYEHTQDVSTSRFNSLMGDDKQIQLDQEGTVSSEEIRSILYRENTDFQERMVDQLITSAREAMAEGDYRFAWDALHLMQERYQDLSYAQSRSRTAKDLIGKVQSVVKSENGQTTADVKQLTTWPVYIRPYRDEFQNDNLPRIERLLMKMDFRMEYEKRGRILLYLGRYQQAYESFVNTLDEDWKERLNTGKSGRADESGTLAFYKDLYRSAILSDQSDGIRRDIRHWTIQLQEENGATQEEVDRIRNLGSQLQEYQQELEQLQQTYVKEMNPVETLMNMMDLLGRETIPNLKKKFLIARSLRKEFPDAPPVQSGDIHLIAARLLMELGDYVEARQLLSSFPEEYPEHEQVRQISEKGGLTATVKKRISDYNLR
jgi:tRNA A-37 threonylcarbamoyl transferase component Bud32/archaellum component FlaC